MKWNNNEETAKNDSLKNYSDYFMKNNIYSVSKVLLEELILSIDYNFSMDGKHSDKEFELVQFLITSGTIYENIFNLYNIVDESKRAEYKIIMMLIIISSAYKYYLHDYARGIEVEKNLININKIEQLNKKEIVYLFNNFENYPLFIDYILKFFVYADQSYVFRNDCLVDIIEKSKKDKLFKINPFEFFELLEYIEPKDILVSGRIIQDYYDIEEYAKKKILIGDEEIDEIEYDILEQIRDEIDDLVYEKFKNKKEEIKSFYGYIFGNVYEYIKINSKEEENNEELIEYFEVSALSDIITRYDEDIEFFSVILSSFTDSNFQLERGYLAEKRSALMKTDGVETLQKLNVYFEEEDKTFQKRMNKN